MWKTGERKRDRVPEEESREEEQGRKRETTRRSYGVSTGRVPET